jgi:hypothetical protein
MAINKNFVVKNGLEVNTQLIYADADTNNVGIASTQPRVELDVRGGIAASNTTVAGVTTVITELRVGTSGTVFTVLGIGNSVGVGTSQPAYLLDIRSPGTGTTALYVQGDMRVTGDINLDDINLDYAQIGSLLVTGISTFQDYIELEDGLEVTSGITTTRSLNVIGFSTLRDNVDVAADVGITSSLIVGAGLSVSGISTFTGLVDVNGGIDVTGVSTFASNLDINSDVDINRSLTITGGSRVTGLSTFTGLVDVNGGLDVTGISTFSNNLDVNADIDVNRSVSITGGLGVTGIGTIGRVKIFNDGTGGIVTATSGIITYYGDGQFLQNIVLGVGIASTNPSTGYSEVVGYGATIITFAGPGVSTDFPISVNAASGIATVYLQGGGEGGFQTTILKEEFTVTTASRTVFSLANPYEFGYIDVYLNGVKLTTSDYTETDTSTVTLTTATTFGDVLEVVNFEKRGISELSPIWRDDGASGGIYTFTTVGVGTSTTTAFFDVYGGMVVRSGVTTISTSLDVNGNADISGITTIGSTLDVNGNADISGITTISGTLDVNGANHDINGAIALDHVTISGIATVSSNLDVNGTNHDINGAIALDHVTVSGITTIGSTLDVNGTNHDINGAIALDHVTVSGIVTATAFVDDGTDLLTEINTKTSTGKAIAMAMVFG